MDVFYPSPTQARHARVLCLSFHLTSPACSDQVYKAARASPDNHASSNRQPGSRDNGTIAGSASNPPSPPGADSEEVDYGPSLPPGDDDDGDDQDGRFFGGGITAQECEVLDYVDGADASTAAASLLSDKIDGAWLRRTAVNFEKRISKNAELRAKYSDDPQKFIASEADLDSDVKALSILAEHPELYADFAKMGCVGSLVSLLAHENTDIAIDAIEIINELTDEDVAAEERPWTAMVDALMNADLLGLLVSNLDRLDEGDELDRNGVYYALSVVENLSGRQETAERVGAHQGLVKWLLNRTATKETPVGQNKQYAAEVLAVLVQNSPQNRRRLTGLDAVDNMLQLVASYRKRDPEKGGEEEEYMENLFEALTCLVDEPGGKEKFVEAEGVELCLIMLKEGKMSKIAALRLLDHSVAGTAAINACQRVVEAGGLKNIFTLFMKKNDSRTSEHIVGIFASMLRQLPSNSAARIRTLAKFVEKDYEKLVKMMQLRREYANKLHVVDESIRAKQAKMNDGDREKMTDEWFSQRLDVGLFSLQTIDIVLAWLVAEDQGARKKIQSLLADRAETLSVIKESMLEQLGGMDQDDSDANDTRNMLSTLIEFLQ